MELNNGRPLNEPIAIVGMSCRFPLSGSLNEFWELLKNGRNTIAEIPMERWDANKYYDPDPLVDRKTQQRHASLLSDIHHFDPLFFNISPAEATEMSPSQKLMLELAWESIESSSIPFAGIQGKKVGVFVGTIWSDFEHFRKEKNAKATLHSAVGMSTNVVANRVSFAFGFEGPSLVIDTGCSASLVALHLACNSMHSGESELALVGGINHILDPAKYIELTQFGGLSKKGMCSSFDNDADGFVRGEGGGVLLLKPLSKAERDGDKIFALIRGTAVNNNGYNDTLPATSIEGQKALLTSAYRSAGINPNEVHYVEAHGTGTKLGDPNEAKAIGEFFRVNRVDNNLRLGSIKTNVGHTEATAGIAGVIKVVLAMKHKMLVPNLNFNTPNSNIPFDELKLEVQNKLTPWPRRGKETLKAGVNSFGWGGTNAHAILEEYVPEKISNTISSVDKFLLPVSAKSTQALKEYATAYASLFKDANEETIKSTCVAASLLKPEFDHRILFSGTSATQLIDNLLEFSKDSGDLEATSLLTENDKIVFVFPGQGAQWLGMGRELISKEKVFLQAIMDCDKAFRPYTDWSLVDQLNASEEKSRLAEINVVQPTICAVQIALARLWMSWGIQPQAVVGHSMGEIAAAHIAGVLTLEDAARIICTRSRLMKAVSGKGGAMAVTELSVKEAEVIANEYPGKISVAVSNSHKSTVLAGDKNCIDKILIDLEQKGLFCRLIKVDVASHSPQMDPLKEELRSALTAVKPQKASIPFISTVRGKFMEGHEMSADYWVENLRNTVQFASAIEQLLVAQHTIFVEINPHPVLINAITECAEHNKVKIVLSASLSRDKPEQVEMLKNLAELYNKGYEIDWKKLLNISRAPHVDLPPYPYQKESYEITDMTSELEPNKDTSAKYLLLGNRINLAGMYDAFYWESIITPSKFPYLKDQQHQDGIEIPMSFYVEIALEAAAEVFKQGNLVQINDLNFSKKVVLPENGRIITQVRLTMDGANRGIVHIFTKESVESEWMQAAECHVSFDRSDIVAESIETTPEDLEPNYTEGLTYYEMLSAAGLTYGSHYQLLTGLNKIGNRPTTNILFSVKASQEIHMAAGKYEAHPALITSFIQPIFGQLARVLEEGHYLNVTFTKIEQFEFLASINYARELRGLMVFQKLDKIPGDDETWSFNANFTIANFDNTSIMTIRGLHGTCTRNIKVIQENESMTKLGNGFLENYTTMEYAAKVETLERILTEAVSSIIKTPVNRIKRTMTFKGMGLDSLMAVQLRNLLEKELKQKLPVGMFWNHPSIQKYTAYLMDLLDLHFLIEPNEIKASTIDTQLSDWFTIPSPNPQATTRLFCFHDAGGSISLFDKWENYFEKSDIELVLVELPGHGRRVEENPITDVTSMLSDLVPDFVKMLDKPFVFLGHSMGGLIAFELIRELRRRQLALPLQLFISSTSGLTAYDKRQVDYRLSNTELVKLYPHLDLSVIGNAEMQQLLVSILKADLQLLYHYAYTEEALIDIPVIAIHGNEDERVKLNQIEQWEKETLSTFKLISRPGGHRYIQQDADFVTSFVKDEMAPIMLLNKVHTDVIKQLT